MFQEEKTIKPMSRLINITENTKVTKSNDLVEAHYKLNLWEQKFLILMASQIQPDDIDFAFYKVKVSDIMSALGLTSRQDSYTRLREMITNLRKKDFVIIVKDEPQTGVIEGSWVSSCFYRDDGYIEFEFSNRLKPYLIKLAQKFTTYKLKYALRLDSVHSIRLYELMKEYVGIGHREISLEKLKLTLGLDTQYEKFGHLKSRVLTPSVAEIKQKTDIAFDFSEVKEGRKVVGLSFKIWKNEKVAEIPNHDRIIQLLINTGVAIDIAYLIGAKGWEFLNKEAYQYLKPRITEGFTFDSYVEEKITLANALVGKGKIKENKAGWIVKAVTHNWIDAQELEKEAKNKARAAIKEAKENKERLEEELRQKQGQEQTQRKNILLKVFHSLPEPAQTTIDEEAKRKYRALGSFFQTVLDREEKDGRLHIEDMKVMAATDLLMLRFEIMQEKYPDKVSQVFGKQK